MLRVFAALQLAVKRAHPTVDTHTQTLKHILAILSALQVKGKFHWFPCIDKWRRKWRVAMFSLEFLSLVGEWPVCWTHRHASGQPEWARWRPKAAAQAQRGPGSRGRRNHIELSPSRPASFSCTDTSFEKSPESLCGFAAVLRTKTETGQCTTPPLAMRALSLRCCRGAEPTWTPGTRDDRLRYI